MLIPTLLRIVYSQNLFIYKLQPPGAYNVTKRKEIKPVMLLCVQDNLKYIKTYIKSGEIYFFNTAFGSEPGTSCCCPLPPLVSSLVVASFFKEDLGSYFLSASKDILLFGDYKWLLFALFLEVLYFLSVHLPVSGI